MDWVGCLQAGTQDNVAGVALSCWGPGRLVLEVDQDSVREPPGL